MADLGGIVAGVALLVSAGAAAGTVVNTRRSATHQQVRATRDDLRVDLAAARAAERECREYLALLWQTLGEHGIDVPPPPPVDLTALQRPPPP